MALALPLVDPQCFLESVVLPAVCDEAERPWTILASWFAIDTLPLVTPMVDAFGSAACFECFVIQVGPPLPCTFDPDRPTKRSALTRPAMLGLMRIGLTKPARAVTIDPRVCVL